MKKTRPYRKIRRAEAESETRSRIIDALMSLHQEVGPARTTISAVADKAGVERLTVYRHFGSELEMLRACSHRWAEMNPPPEVRVQTAGDPLTAARAAIGRMYSWYRRNVRILAQITNDLDRVEGLSELYAPFEKYLDNLAAALDGNWARRNLRRIATLRHALGFNTWRSLDRLTSGDRQAAAIAASWIGAQISS